MEEDFLRDHPELRLFVLSDVQLTGTTIGGGAYGQVEEVAFPVEAAAKTITSSCREGLTSCPRPRLVWRSLTPPSNIREGVRNR